MKPCFSLLKEKSFRLALSSASRACDMGLPSGGLGLSGSGAGGRKGVSRGCGLEVPAPPAPACSSSLVASGTSLASRCRSAQMAAVRGKDDAHHRRPQRRE